ncbi:MAG: discoidin domain-containing protein [Clostridia bacterium]|nr:discoidin domain-containing protein [Clostridia bacterium]
MKKTLATLLVVALMASFCGVMMVSASVAGEGNLALGKTWSGDTEIGTSYVGDLTDGKIESTGAYDQSLWYGADIRLAEDDSAFNMILDLEDTYNNISDVGLHVWPAGISGIMIPGSIVFSASEDGETYTELGTVSSYAGTAPQWVRVQMDAPVTARYIKIDMVGGESGVFWFASEIEVNAGEKAPVVEDPNAVHTVTLSHVNLYSWNAYNCQIITGEGNNSQSYAHTAFDATGYVVVKAENVGGVYTVTAVEGAGVEKTLTAPADGFLLYCAPNDTDSIAAGAKIEVGDVLLETDVDWHTDVASATPIGTMTFGAPVEEEKPDAPVVKETIAIDGKLDDDGYDKAVWFSDGIWQTANGATLEDLDVSYTVRSDDDNIYLTVKVNQGVDFEKALDPAAWDQSGATNFRIWLLGDGMETRTFYDLLWDGEAFVPFRQKTATDELTFAAGIGDDYINMEIAIAKSSLNITDSFKLMVTYSTPHCLNADGTTAYNAFHMTACEEMPSGWSGNADAYESYNCADIALGTKVPATGDESVLVFAVLGLLAIAGAAVAIKVKG